MMRDQLARMNECKIDVQQTTDGFPPLGHRIREVESCYFIWVRIYQRFDKLAWTRRNWAKEKRAENTVIRSMGIEMPRFEQSLGCGHTCRGEDRGEEGRKS